MGKRTGVYPHKNHTVAERVLCALDMYDNELAKVCGVTTREMRRLLKSDNDTESVDLWWAISEYVDEQIGLLLASKREIGVKLGKQRALRATRFAAQMQRGGRSSPRS